MVNLYSRAFLYADNEVLLLRRCNVSFGNGLYSLCGGRVEQHETARQAIKREVYEEVHLFIPEQEFQLVHVFHRKSDAELFVVLCFKVNISDMVQPSNNEPEKHDDLRFFAIEQLPDNIIPAHKQAIECIKQNISYSEHGWEL